MASLKKKALIRTLLAVYSVLCIKGRLDSTEIKNFQQACNLLDRVLLYFEPLMGTSTPGSAYGVCNLADAGPVGQRVTKVRH